MSDRIVRSYIDAAGKRRQASPEGMDCAARLLHGFGKPPLSNQRTRAELDGESRPLIEPVMVAWDSKPFRINLAFPNHTTRSRIRVQLRLESGESRTIPVASGTSANARLSIPGLPFGYHELIVSGKTTDARTLIITAPSRAFTPAEPTRRWGLFLPVYAAASKTSPGAATFRDYTRLSQWAGVLGATFMGTLPLLACFLDGPLFDPSPYAAVSRLFWNEFYLDLSAIPELRSCKAAQRILDSKSYQTDLKQFRGSERVDFQQQAQARRKVLEELARYFSKTNSTRRDEFETYRANHADLEDYARFRATCEFLQMPWQSWPARLRNGQLRPGDYSDEARFYHLYVQWLAHQQLRDLLVRSKAAGVDLYLDLPVGVHADGYDVWKEQDLFVTEASVGAPPDPFFAGGQNWGFPPLHPEKLRQTGYAYFIRYLRFHLRHARLLRIDHVMGLHRLYWIPQGRPASEGVYVRYPADEFYAILALESHRYRAVLVGENLGTVPPEVNVSMRKHRLYQMYVMPFHQQPDPRRAVDPPERQVVASLNTHDLPTFAAHWKGQDILDRETLGSVTPDQARTDRQTRRALRHALSVYLRSRQWIERSNPTLSEALQACLRWLASSQAEFFLINLEDLWLEPRQQNMPGTTTQYPNWKRKMRYTLEELFAQADSARLLQIVSELRARAHSK